MRPIRTLALCIAVLAAPFAPRAHATAQEPDLLALDGETVALHTNPLAPLLKAGTVALPEPEVDSSGNWRGYVATWAVDGGALVLRKVEMRRRMPGADPVRGTRVDVMPTMFPGKAEVKADWYTGTLLVPRGAMVDYVHMGYGSTYERYVVIDVKAGAVTARRDVDAAGYAALRKARFERFKKTPAYAAYMKDRTESGAPAMTDGFLYEFAVEEYMAAAE